MEKQHNYQNEENKILSALLTVAPMLNDLYYDDICVSINDRQKILAYYPGETFDLGTKAGAEIQKNWLVNLAMEKNKKIVKEQDASVIGIPYVGIALPITDDMGGVIGGISILQSTEKTVRLQEMANKLTGFIDNLTSTMEEISAESEELTASSEEIAAVSEQTKLQVNETEEIAQLINKISRRINLIGLNAAIEAARVGSEGSGFKVVADEIRNLALQSAESLAKINEILNSIRDGISNLTEGVKLMSTSSDNQARVLESIAQEVEEVNLLSHDLYDFAKSLSEGDQRE